MKTSPTLSESGKYLGDTMWNRGFIAMCVTQFTVAFNDNAFRWLLVPIGKAYIDGDFIRSLGAFFLLVPFLLWTSIAGYVTDRFSRRSVMIWAKLIEMILLAAAVGVIMFSPAVSEAPPQGTFSMPWSIIVLLGILFLLGSQSAFFSPSKYSTIPDLVPVEKLSAANGFVSMLTMTACVSGMVLGGYLFAWTTIFQEITNAAGIVEKAACGVPGGNHVWITALCLVGIAAIGLFASFFIPKMKPVDETARFPVFFFSQTAKDIASLFSYRKLFWIAAASAFFWGLAALAQNNIDKFATEYLMVQQQYVTQLAAILTIGIGIGAVLCGYLSGKRIELGIVPVALCGMGVFILLLGFTPGYAETIGAGMGDPTKFPYLFALGMMFITGLWAGLYDIPLSAYIQHNSPSEKRGRIIAAYNFLNFSAMLVFIGLGFAMAKLFGYIQIYDASLMIWIATGLMTLAVFFILAYTLFVPFMNILFTFMLWLIYRPKVIGLENIPEQGGALFASNHVSLLDGPLLYTASKRNIRFFAHSHFIPAGLLDHLAHRTRVIRVLPGKKVVAAIREAREGLKNGDSIGIFPEGGITRTGQMKAFENGFLSILKGDEDVPIIPVYIGGLYGSMFSYKYGSVITPWPRKLLQRPIIAFGKPIYRPKNAMEVQRVVEELGVETMKQNGKELPFPAVQMLKNCRKVGSREFLLDSTGLKVTGRKLLTAVLALRRILRREVLAPEEKHVGLFVPMSVGGSVANAVLAADSRTAVNLNFTFTEEILNQCLRKAEVKHVLTSRKMLERFPNLKFDAELVYVEELRQRLTLSDKIFAALGAYVLPVWLLKRLLGLHRLKADDPLAIVFTSGSTGRPKGAVLTQRNIAEEAKGFIDTVHITPKDTLLGFLPFFHAFGYAGNFWLTILSGCKGVFHYSPLEAKKIGEMARKYKCTFLPSTPTFLRNYLRRCPKEDFENLKTVICGAEKMPLDLIEAWEQKYGVRPSEGFGTTELSPCANVNLPDPRIRDTFNKYRKDGSVGRPLPNVAMKIVDLETGEDLPPGEIGMMVAKGPIVMQGYYKEPELTAEVISPDGWYRTGDVGKVDTDGFFWITGRQSRISKIGGEMVPHVLIEEKILGILQDEGDEFEGMPIAVSAVPDEKKGERIIVLHEKLTVSVEAIRAKMLEADLPNIWIPGVHSFYEVEKVPLLGTGKLDLAAVKQMARSLVTPER